VPTSMYAPLAPVPAEPEPEPEPEAEPETLVGHQAIQDIPSRLHTDTESALTMIPTTKWVDVAPGHGCIDELRGNPDIRSVVKHIDSTVEDIRMKVLELQHTHSSSPVTLTEDCIAAIVAYTHDLQHPLKDGNIYYELNIMLRQRGAVQRAQLVKTWGGFMYYMMTGLNMLPDFNGVCWRGYNHGSTEDVIREYTVGRPIQWGAFTSVTTNLRAAKSFAPDTRVVFKITIMSGRDINDYSFFPQEGEILLSPSHRFLVSSEPREQDGYTFIDLVQATGNTFVS
jgi:hypothetical protein